MMTQKDIENLTKEQALQLHKEMWLEISKSKFVTVDGVKRKGLENCERASRSVLKSRYLEERNIELLHDCFLCEFAAQELFRKEGLGFLDGNYCKYCPVNWCKDCKNKCNCIEGGYFCECAEGGLIWGLSNIMDIANIKEKREN